MKIVKETKYDLVEDFLKSNFSSPTHWPDWNLVVSKHFDTEFLYLCAYEDEEVIGICPVHKQKKGILSYYQSGQFHYIPFGGWIFSKNVNHQRNKLPIENLAHFQMFCLPSINEFNAQYQKNNINYKTLVLDLREDLEVIWNEQIHSKRKNKIRKAKKNKIRIEATKIFNNSFFTIYKNSSTRNNLKLLPPYFFTELYQNSNNISFEIISAIKNDKYIANVVIAYDKNYSIYWLGNNAYNSPNLGQGDLLQWEVIKRMKQNGCFYYDLCYIEKERLPNIYKFKSGFCKNEIDVPNVVSKSISFRLINKLNKLITC